MVPQRFDSIDALRGAALVWMTLFHFGFDLNHFGYLVQDFHNDPVWTLQRTLILSLFLFCAGLGQAVALQRSQTWARFWRRWAQVAGCAALVSAGSYLMYPKSFIFFGVLHGIAVMLVMVRLSAHWGRWLWLLGLAAVAAPPIAAALLQSSDWAGAFNSHWLSWLGLVTRKPITEDYVPLLPWLGLVWWGMASGTWLQRHRPGILSWRPALLGRPLAALGRWSLSYYMLHQPLMIGALMLFGAAAK